MGKKRNKRKGKKKSNVREKLSVTIATPTMISRIDYLEVLIQCILHQDYNNILEWIIVDGTQNDEHALREYVDRIRKEYPKLPEIVFLEPPPDNNKTIGALRNVYNEHCRGDIIVCMDDDDYYPQTRVSHCVKKLKNSHLEIGACANLCIYCIEFKKVYEWKQFHINQGGNASMAYTKNYAKTHTYEHVACGEEKTFIKNYMGYGAAPGTEKEQTMIQFDKEHSLLSIAHSSTYKKTKNFYQNELRPKENKFIYNSSFSLGSYITNTKILKMYKRLFKKHDCDNEDITVIMRQSSVPLKLSQPLVHSENQQLQYLSNYYKKKGKRIIVYADIEDEEKKEVDGIKLQNETITMIDNVEYRHMYTIDTRQKFKHVIAIGKESLDLLPILNVQAENIHFVHTHYTDKITNDIFDDIAVNTFISRSTHLQQELIASNTYVKDILPTKKIVPLAINKTQIDTIIHELQTSPGNKPVRNPYRFCFTNAYERGVMPIIQYLYPELKKIEPKVELHLYGGINTFVHPELKKMLETHIDQSGIIDHGLCPYEEIIKEKLQSTFHIYFIDEKKHDSLSSKESVYCDCIPILSNKGVFKDLQGLHFDFNTEQVQSYKNVANIIGELLQNTDKIDKVRHKICSDKQKIPTLEDIMTTWDSIIEK